MVDGFVHSYLLEISDFVEQGKSVGEFIAVLHDAIVKNSAYLDSRIGESATLSDQLPWLGETSARGIILNNTQLISMVWAEQLKQLKQESVDLDRAAIQQEIIRTLAELQVKSILKHKSSHLSQIAEELENNPEAVEKFVQSQVDFFFNKS
jgi:hypothetical protein